MGGVGTGSAGVSTTGNATGDSATLTNVNAVLNIFVRNLQDILDDFKVGSFTELGTDVAINVMEKSSIFTSVKQSQKTWRQQQKTSPEVATGG